MTAFLCVSVLLVILYVGVAIWRKRELPESISAMVYILPEGGWRWLWSLWLIVVSVLTFAPVIEILDKRGLGFLAFLPIVFNMFVAVWPLYDTEHKPWHYAFGIASGVVSQVCVWLMNPYWLWMWLLMIAIPMIDRMWWHQSIPVWMWRRGVFFAEVICYTTLVMALLTNQ